MKTSDALRPRLLVIGAGDVAWRALPWLKLRFRVVALCRSADGAERWRSGGAATVTGDLDERSSLRRLAGLAEHVIYTAPPGTGPLQDLRLQRFLACATRPTMVPRSLVYVSTTGVYGDCGGARIDECQPRRAVNARAQRRVAAETQLRAWLGRQARQDRDGPRTRVVILRAPGIYAEDRLPLARLRAGTPALRREEDSWTNHIHADDLAHAVVLALFRSRGGRAFNVSDDSELRMGDWFDRVAGTFGIAPPERITRVEAEQRLPESLLSFMRESRRLDATRSRRELRLVLSYPTVAEGLAAAAQYQRMLPVGSDGGGRSGHQQGDGGQIGQQPRPGKQ